MALAARPKPKSYYKKRTGEHHRQGKNYSKVYYPYLPMFAILGSGLLANSVLPSALSANADPLYQSRLAVISGVDSAPLYYLVLGVTLLAFVALALSHSGKFYRLIIRGENYIVKHPAYDTCLVAVITVGLLLVRA